MNILLISPSSTTCPRLIHQEVTAYLPNKTPLSDRCDEVPIEKLTYGFPGRPGHRTSFCGTV